MITFRELGLKEEILKGIEDLGFTEPMPIQEKVTPFLLGEDESDLVGLAQTGTGKTAGFGLPILHLTDVAAHKIQTLIIAPTRELCVQISNDLKNYSKYMPGVKVVPVYGGEDIRRQLKQLDVPPQILVATPGRLVDLIDRKKVKLSSIRYLILDEADEMLNMGFQEDIERILEETPTERRTLLFSATMPKEIAHIARKYMKNAIEISIGRKNSGAENVQHIFYMVQAKNRYTALKRVVDINPDIYGIVFCRTRQETKEVADSLMKDGYNADALHGDLSQAQRDTVMQKFRIKNLQLLVATDVAARGLDVSDLTHVINYNLPDDLESYTHRSGRTGRANKSGISISIIHTKERGKIREIERNINKTFEQARVPSGLEVCQSQLFAMINKLQNANVNEDQIEQYLPMVMKQLEEMDREQLIKNFVSLEFNRFLDYYKDAPDLNLPEKEQVSDKKKSSKSERTRLKINIGQREGFTPKRVLGLINDTMNDKSIAISGLEITSKFSFFDVESNEVRRMLNAFTMHAESGIILTEVLNNRKPGSRSGKRDKFERKDRQGEYRGSGGFRGKNSESGKEWRTRKSDDNNKSKKRDSEYYKKKKDGFKRNR
jgi:ATP-dependent RNA helicase DeaD